MNKVLTYLIFAAISLQLSVTAHAYELATHARITYKAFATSVLNKDQQILTELGINLSEPDEPFGSIYYDIGGQDGFTIEERIVNSFEAKFIVDKAKLPTIPLSSSVLSLEGWLMRGAIREDDTSFGENPKDDPVNAIRVLNHFYDPVYDRPLTVGLELGDKAPNWAFGTFDFTASPIQDKRFINHYTIFDAQDAMYRALTGHDKNGNTEIGANGELEATKAIRQAYWATTFRALGDVVHLMQDMSQPQHTRNDRHDPYSSDERQIYEEYTNKRALNVEFEKCFNGTNKPVAPLKYSLDTAPYPIPKFDKYGEFFTTNPGSTTGGKGLADFSNYNFFSEGTNILANGGSGEYPNPSLQSVTLSKPVITFDPCLTKTNMELNVFKGTVHDQKTGIRHYGVALTTRSLWDHPDGDNLPKYVLARENYDAMADLLIPRAVSYSSGLINHFFRGRLQVLQASKLGNELTLRFKNDSATDLNNNGITFTDGKFEVFYEDINGIMQPLTVTSSDLPSGDTTVATGDNMLHDNIYTFTITHPSEDNIALPPYTDTSGNKLGTNTPFVLVFRGQIGQDAGIAAITFARDGLLAYYGLDDDFTTPTTSFEFQVTANPANAWRNYSLGPLAPATGLDPGWATYLGNNQITMNGGYATTGTSGSPPTLFRSLDGGRSFVEESDLTPSRTGDGPREKSYYQYTKTIFTGGTSLATLRYVGSGTEAGTLSYRIHQSDDLGQNWVAGALLDNVVQELDALVYLGESAGLKRYVTIAQHKALDSDTGQLVTKWALLRSNDSGQSFVVEPITEVTTYAPNSIAANGTIVHMGTDVSGNATLGLAIKEALPDIPSLYNPYHKTEINFYLSTDSGLSWSKRSTLLESPRILTGKFPPSAENNGQVGDLIYLGTPDGGQPVLYHSLTHKYDLGNQATTELSVIYIKEFFLSNDGGMTWVSTLGPDLGITNYTESNGDVWERMTKFPWLVYPLDSGAIPGLYD